MAWNEMTNVSGDAFYEYALNAMEALHAREEMVAKYIGNQTGRRAIASWADFFYREGPRSAAAVYRSVIAVAQDLISTTATCDASAILSDVDRMAIEIASVPRAKKLPGRLREMARHVTSCKGAPEDVDRLNRKADELQALIDAAGWEHLAADAEAA